MFNLRGLLALFRPKPDVPFERALRDIAHGRYEDALAVLENLARTELPRDQRAAVANKRGVALVQLHRRDDAREAFEEALSILPAYAPALVNLGNLRLEAGELDQSVGYYERALRADDEYAPAHHNLSVAYKRLGRTSDAVRELRRAYKLEGRVIRRRRSME